MDLNLVIETLDLKKDNLSLLSKNFKTVKVTDQSSLETFYIVSKINADTLTLEDEFVGLTYSNLKFLEKFINFDKPKQKTLKK